MDNYIVSARKYRPSTFHSVVGQQALTVTLKNAILNQKLAHAYLFCGPRGVGKTTCARIFAKSINCTNPGADGEACNECESCRSFNENRSYNIHELDAASNNGVDDIRALTEQVRIPPQTGKYKVYIIDEVHMLSSGAFNAFLKTLEEPPKHAIFILATTEKHKLLATILSRCQIYDFSRISLNDIVDYLAYVADSEGIQYEREALGVIAQKADGGMRDALSIFDQVASYSQENVTYQSVIANLNVLDYEYYFQLSDALLDANVSQSLLLLNAIISKGFDGQQIISGLAAFFRDVLVCKDPQTADLFEVGEAVRNKYVELAHRCTTDFLYKAIELTNETDLSYRQSRNRRLMMELLLIRLAQLNHPSDGSEDKKKNVIESILPPGGVEQAETTTAPQPPVAAIPKAISTPKPQAESSAAKVISKSSLHISLRNPIKKEEPAATTDNIMSDTQAEYKETFQQSDLAEAWHSYISVQTDDFYKNTITYVNPLLQDDNRIVFEVYGTSLSSLLNEHLVDMTRFLRQALRNSDIKIEVVQTTDESKRLPFTSKEKYDYLAEKNPAIHFLVKEFNLRLD